MMTDWYQRSINALQLNGKGERTQEAYTRAVRMLSAFYGKPPDEITEPELEAYFHSMHTPGFLNIGLKRPRRSSQSLWVMGSTAAGGRANAPVQPPQRAQRAAAG